MEIFNQMTDTGFYEDEEEVTMLDGRPKKEKKKKERLVYAAPFHTQVNVLLVRTWRTIWREKVNYYSFTTFCQLASS